MLLRVPAVLSAAELAQCRARLASAAWVDGRVTAGHQSARVKENEHLRRTPVVVLTTTDDQREIQRCYDLGCNVYITKPVNYDGFANAIRQLGLFFSVIQVPATA